MTVLFSVAISLWQHYRLKRQTSSSKKPSVTEVYKFDGFNERNFLNNSIYLVWGVPFNWIVHQVKMNRKYSSAFERARSPIEPVCKMNSIAKVFGIAFCSRPTHTADRFRMLAYFLFASYIYHIRFVLNYFGSTDVVL